MQKNKVVVNENPELPLLKLMTQCFDNPYGEQFVCGFRFEPAILDLNYQIMCEKEYLSHAPLVESHCDCIITMPLTHARLIEENIEDVDFRDTQIIASISIEGSLEVANFVAKSLLKPSPWISQRFSQSEREHGAIGARHWLAPKVIHKPSLLEILSAMKNHQPCILRGLNFEKPCDYWSIDNLERHFASAVVKHSPVYGKQTMSDFIEQMGVAPNKNAIEGFTKCYTEGSPLPLAMQPFFELPFLYEEDFIEPQLWFGRVNRTQSASSLHRDPLHGFLHQVIGRKHIRLYSSDQAPLLYPMQNYNLYQPCWVNPNQPSAIHPKFQLAQAIEFVLQAGEVLLTPYGWFHEVHTIDNPTLSVSHFWRY